MSVVATTQTKDRVCYCFETQSIYFFASFSKSDIKKIQDEKSDHTCLLNKDTQVLVLEKLKLRNEAKELKVT